ncbi:QRFP-like peptide receptor [Hydractinia symbiolongicarpus]|uniref:QRFP-like peptide receptor n=1 Tax=Hydractinia symbiolongicarpus TaxID=13093 RepID=UPI00254EE5E8|nr:QRFP-like peptide receptor [Hydractinia symbiolongicarpus]
MADINQTTFKLTAKESNSGTVILILDSISSCILVVALFFNWLGILLLYQQKTKRYSNQKLILTTLSMTVICISTTDLTYTIGKFTGLENDAPKIYFLCEKIIASIFITYYLVLFLLTIDRFLAFILILRYKVIVTAYRIKLYLVLCWIIGPAVATPFFFLGKKIFFDVWYKFIYLILDSIILLTVVVTYSYILFSFKHRSYIQKQGNTHRHHHGHNKIFLVISLITISFVFMVAIPDAIHAYRFVMKYKCSEVEVAVVGICWKLNYILDPAIYIFLHREIRKMLVNDMQKLKSFFSNR